MNPGWLEAVAWVSLGLAVASALVILLDELVFGHRQMMGATRRSRWRRLRAALA